MMAPLWAGAFGAWAQVQNRVASQARSPRMPVLFLGHGSPMNAIEDNSYRRSWQALGQEFGARYPKPQLIVCVSAHWLTQGWWFTGAARPKTIHDFGGFPQALFDQQYPALGAPEQARDLARSVSATRIQLDEGEWGYDHGTWSVLKPMFPKADIPLVQLSMDYSQPPATHYALARELRRWRERGVLIVGSGNIVHNLRQSRRGAPSIQAYDWALEFDQTVARQIEQGDLDALQRFQQLGTVAQQAHPTWEHYLPLLYTAAVVDAKEPVRFFNTSFQSASIAMRSVVWG